MRHGQVARHGQLLRRVQPHAADARRVRLPDGLPRPTICQGRPRQPDTGGHQRDNATPGGQKLFEDVMICDWFVFDIFLAVNRKIMAVAYNL